jgi:hypothetical protein
VSNIKTVGDLVAALQQLPQDLPVLAGCHYDNDNALTNDVHVNIAPVFQVDGEFHDFDDPHSPTGFKAVTIA